MRGRVLYWLSGYLELRARGRRLASFVNLAIDAGAVLWNLRRAGEDLCFRLRLRDFRRLRPWVRSTGTRVHIVLRGGLPFFLRRALRRRVLAGAGVAALLAVYALSGYVWIVDVSGAHAVPAWEVEAAAARLGLRPGVPKASLDAHHIAEQLPLLVPGVEWAGVTVRGTRATIEVAERAQAPGTENAAYPADVVARTDGVVTGVLAMTGEPLVMPGDTVRRGQVLIAGRMLGPHGAETPVHARGTVTARVWYDKYVEVNLQQTQVEPTGRAVVRRVIRLFGREIELGGWRPVPFADYQIDRSALLARWRGVSLPFAVETLRYREVVRSRLRLTEAEAEAKAEAVARSELRQTVPPGARVLSQDPQVVQVTAGRLGLVLRVEVEENIGLVRPIPSGA